jgi:endonuclease/exonuclease/phosphatase family metal-dependent hydrolase
MRPIRVVTLNLWCESEPFLTRLEAAIDALVALEPDVVALQEVVDRGPSRSGARRLAEALGAAYTFGVVDPASAVGNAIVSRLRIIESGAVALPSSPSDPRGALAALLETEAGRLPLVSTHLSWEPEHAPRRGAQAGALASLALGLPGELPAVVAGDLNETPEGAAIARLREGGLRDAFAEKSPGALGYTWSARNPFTRGGHGGERRLDYVMVAAARGGFGAISRAEVVLDRPGPRGVFPSDHFGVLAEISPTRGS